MNSRLLSFLSTSLSVILLAASVAHALDYNATWSFDQPIGHTAYPDWFDRDFLIYNARTGELTYDTGDDGGWSPPDLASRSGSFLTTANLPPVPLGTDFPLFGVNETIAGIVVPGSNAIHIGFDPYIFWPRGMDDPLVLSARGLAEVPTSYHYGAVLPPGLRVSFLQSDLYAAFFPDSSYVQLIRRIPEPASVLMLLVAIAILSIMRQRDRVL